MFLCLLFFSVHLEGRGGGDAAALTRFTRPNSFARLAPSPHQIMNLSLKNVNTPLHPSG